MCVCVYSAHKHTHAESDGLESFRDDLGLRTGFSLEI